MDAAVTRARMALARYVEQRRAKGATVEVEQDAYVSGPYARAVLVINGVRRRVYNPWGCHESGKGWMYA